MLKLARRLYGKGHIIFMDRYYTSPNLLYWLRQMDLSACGTAMTNRSGFTKQLRKQTRSEQGEMDWLQCEMTGILATRWCDKKNIYFLSNQVVAEMDGLTITRHTKTGDRIEVPCTPTVHEYNRYMGAVDLNDKMCRLDKSRRTYKWYVRVDCKCVAWALYSAYVIESKFRVHGPTHDFRTFTLDVIHQLIGTNRFRSRQGRPTTAVALPARMTDTTHFPVRGDGKDHGCVVCADKHRRYQKAHPTALYSQNPSR